MQEKFDSLGSLMKCYQEVKLSLPSATATWPRKDKQFEKQNPGKQTQSLREDKLVFVIDVEKFIKYFHGEQRGYFLIPIDCVELIFYLAMYCDDLTVHNTYGRLVRHFKIRMRNGEKKIPRRLQNKGNLHVIAKDMRVKAEEYYRKKRLIADK